MEPSAKPERLVMAKELVDYFAARGVTIHYRYARSILAACPHTVRRRYVLPGAAWEWWVMNPGWMPNSRKGPPAQGTLGGQG